MEAGAVDREFLERCPSCGGEFCAHEVLRSLLEAHLPKPGTERPYNRPSPLSDPVRYRKCPSCGELMHRRNFKDSSGIIVDVCTAHGVWFDKGELGMVLEFVNTGAFARAEREQARRAESRRQLDSFARRLQDAGPRHYVSVGGRICGPIEDLQVAELIEDLLSIL